MLERGSQVHFMAEFQELLDFPPAPKLDVVRQARPAQRERAPSCAGESVFFGKGQCVDCHPPPYYTDNLMHDLQVERFFKPRMINGQHGRAPTARSRPSRCAASRTRRRTCTTAGC